MFGLFGHAPRLVIACLLLAASRPVAAGVMIEMPRPPAADSADVDATYQQHVNGTARTSPGATVLARYAFARRRPTWSGWSWPGWSGYRYTYGYGVYYSQGYFPFYWYGGFRGYGGYRSHHGHHGHHGRRDVVPGQQLSIHAVQGAVSGILEA